MRRLLVPGLLIYLVILYRASYQAVTLDEADSFLNFATGNLDMSFYPSSGNHVLNSLLSRFMTQLLGMSPLTLRGAAMVGAAIYLTAAAALATRIAGGRLAPQLLGFALLTLNPFVLDYLIASRGYALALGLLAAAVGLALGAVPDWRRNILMSLCFGLAFTANFSFAFAIVCAAAAYLITLRAPWKRWLGFAAATTIPGALTALALVGATLRSYPREQLYYGAATWTETWTEMLNAVFPDRNLSFERASPILAFIHPTVIYWIWIPLAIALWLAIKPGPIRFIWAALLFTLTSHGLAHVWNGLLLPLDRTSLFLAFFLSVLMIYAVSASRAAVAVAVAVIVIFALAFRTNYFRIWEFDMDVDRGYAAFVQYSQTHPIASAGCTWRYGGAYNFYRLAQHHESLPKCEYIDQDNPPPRTVYFLNVPGQAGFIQKEKLSIIFEGPVSGLTVAVRGQQ